MVQLKMPDTSAMDDGVYSGDSSRKKIQRWWASRVGGRSSTSRSAMWKTTASLRFSSVRSVVVKHRRLPSGQVSKGRWPKPKWKSAVPKYFVQNRIVLTSVVFAIGFCRSDHYYLPCFFSKASKASKTAKGWQTKTIIAYQSNFWKIFFSRWTRRMIKL